MPTVEDPREPSEQNRDRVWQQIDEILEKDERSAPEKIRVARPAAPRKVRAGTPFWYPTPEKLIALGIALMVIAVVARRFVLPLTLGGFVLAGIGYYMLVMRKRRAKWGFSSGSRGETPTQYWRGKPVDRSGTVKKRDGNIIEFPDSLQNKTRRRFGRKK